MNGKLVQIINRGIEQGLHPLALAACIEFAIQKGEIVLETTPTHRLQCVDCGHHMEEMMQGQHVIVTCKHKNCTLYGVTLSTDQYVKLTPVQLDEYRRMVVISKERNHE